LGLGDLLTGVPALRALARSFPGHRHVLAAPAELADLARLTGAVDAVVATKPLRPLPAVLDGADVAVDLHGRGPASQRVLLDSGPRRLVAFSNDAVPATRGFPAWRSNEHEVVRWCRMLSESGIPADPGDLDLDVGLVPRSGTTIVHPGAAYPARRWPADRWAAVARHEHSQDREVLVTGGPAEVSLARGVARGAGLGDDAVIAGRTDLVQQARLVASAERVVCADTGVAHLATAMRTPSVVLFGPVSPALWGPPADRPWHRALWAGHAGDPRGASVDPGLLEITVDDVTCALGDLPAAMPDHAREPR
jgi:ADP-heptose:LPS heptosyltransferase